MNNAMQSQEDHYLEEPEYALECLCGTKLKNGSCPDCDAPEYNTDERIDG